MTKELGRQQDAEGGEDSASQDLEELGELGGADSLKPKAGVSAQDGSVDQD